jgi:hypothetical protein
VDDGIDRVGAGELQGPMVGGEEIRAPVRSSRPRPQRLIETEMGVGQEQKTHRSAHGATILPIGPRVGNPAAALAAEAARK